MDSRHSRTGGGTGTTRDIHGQLHLKGKARPASRPAGPTGSATLIGQAAGPAAWPSLAASASRPSRRWSRGTVSQRAKAWTAGLGITAAGGLGAVSVAGPAASTRLVTAAAWAGMALAVGTATDMAVARRRAALQATPTRWGLPPGGLAAGSQPGGMAPRAQDAYIATVGRYQTAARSADPQQQQQAAASRDTMVRTMVALNPCCVPAVAQHLSQDRAPQVRQGLASNPACPPAVLRDLSADPDPAVRYETTFNPGLPYACLHSLAGDQELAVSQAATAVLGAKRLARRG